MSYSVQKIAQYILTYCNAKVKPINNFKLQTMLYHLWVDYYKKTKLELFLEMFSAWKIGPIVPESYRLFCHYGALPIDREFHESINASDKDIINSLIEKYLPKSGRELYLLSTYPGSPWAIIYQEGKGIHHPIPFYLIKEKEK